MLLFLKGCFNIEGKIVSAPEGQNFTFNVPFDKSAIKVDLILLKNEKRIETFHEFDISEEMLYAFQNDTFFKTEKPDKLDNELTEMKTRISKATETVLTLIKYCFQQYSVHENLFSSKDYYWSTNKSNWKKVPIKLSVIIDNDMIITLNEEKSKNLQQYINNGFRPFFALRHLHRAKNEVNPRYKWIDATIAAELAIKEFLIIKVPKIEALLNEVPSPPLDKLYGSILENYTGERSPRLKAIRKGVETRNKLVHRPERINIDRKDANKYVHDVETAIYHLLSLLYPKDQNIHTLYHTHLGMA